MWRILHSTRALRSISTNTIPSHYFYSSTFVAADETTKKKKKETCESCDDKLMLDYLINSIGLSKQEAISASSKVSHLKSTQNPDSVINFFKIYGGLDKSQIKDVVFSVPRVLTHRADQNLVSKFRALKEFGLSGSNLVKFIKKHPDIFKRGLDTNIIPTLSYLNKFLGGCKEDLVKVLCRAPWLMPSANIRNVQTNLLLLKDFEFSQCEMRHFFIMNPRALTLKPESFQNVVQMVKVKLKIPRESRMFIHGISIGINDAMFERKMDVFRSFGWSDSDVLTLVRNLPRCATVSEVKIRNALNFFMKGLRYDPLYLASHPAFFTCSLEKRVMPRYEVWKTLKEHNLIKSDKPLYTLVICKEAKFLMNFVFPYKDELPCMYETYTTSMQHPSEVQGLASN